MRIQGLGVIDDAVLSFAPGLTVVTGETGAGKTMVVQGLQLLFGARADPLLVRAGAVQSVVEGRLRVDETGHVAARVADAGGVIDAGELLLSRAVATEGRSRAHAGGRAVPAAVLAELGESLLAVHAQSDQRRLLRPSEQRDALDRYAGAPVLGLRAEFAAAFERHGAVSARLSALVDQARERLREADVLRHGLREIERVAPVAGEDAALALEIVRLTHADDLAAGAAGAAEALSGTDAAAQDLSTDAMTLVAAARRQLESLREHDPALDDLAKRLADVSYQLADVAADISSYATAVDTDPLRLAAAHDRQAALGELTRRYGPDVAGVLEWARDAAARLSELDDDDDTISTLQAEQAELRQRLQDLAGALSAARSAAAAQFGRDVTAELAGLAMPKAVVTVGVTQRTDADGLLVAGRPVAYGPTGVDDVEIRLASHPGAPARPVAKAASGGELSRVMLAIEVIFAGATGMPTFVFDEVDAGVGGKAAVEIGKRLAVLARTAQVIVVTHLPQVAAFADRHLRVLKNDDGLVTATSVVALDDAERVAELSRMLAGVEESALALGHAEELLQLAATAKAR